MLRRTVCAALALSSCTGHTIRPIADASLVQVQAIDAEYGLALFDHATAPSDRPRYYAAKIHQDGPIAWLRPLVTAGRPEEEASLRVFGGFAAVPLHHPSVDGAEGRPMLRIRLADGASAPWTGPGGLSRVYALVGDARQVFGVFVGEASSPGAPRPLEIAAWDAGDPQDALWSAPGRLRVRYPREFFVRVDERHLLYSEPGAGLHALRRGDGEEVATIAAEPAFCLAAGRWWAQRGDRLLAIDLRGEAPATTEAPADFVEPELRWQWSIADCAAYKDAVILQVNVEPWHGSVLVAVDAATGRTRWTLRGSGSFAQASAEKLVEPPASFGDVATIFRDGPCLVDLAGGRIRWCLGSRAVYFVPIAAGEETLLLGENSDDPSLSYVARVGAGGEVEAAVELRGLPRTRLLERDLLPIARSGRLWFAGVDRDTRDVDELPRLTLDARTLQPVGRLSPAIAARDVMAEVDTLLIPEPVALRPPAPPEDMRAVNPVDLEFAPSSAPASRNAPLGVPGDVHPTVIAAVRAAAALAPETPVRVVAWRTMQLVPNARLDRVLAFAEEQAAGAPRRWVVAKVEAVDGRVGGGAIVARTFLRQPSNGEVYRVALAELDVMLFLGLDVKLLWQAGAIDDAAWQELTGAPRTELWQLR